MDLFVQRASVFVRHAVHAPMHPFINFIITLATGITGTRQIQGFRPEQIGTKCKLWSPEIPLSLVPSVEIPPALPG